MASHTAGPMNEAGVTQVVMPQMGESLSEGTIVRWLKQVGEHVGHDEPLFELSTDKVDTDVPAPAAGVLKAILAAEGETVAVGMAVALIETEAPAGTGPSAAPPVQAPVAASSTEESGGHFKSSHAPQLVSFRRERSGDTAPPSLLRMRPRRHWRPPCPSSARRAPRRIRQINRSHQRCWTRRVERRCRWTG